MGTTKNQQLFAAEIAYTYNQFAAAGCGHMVAGCAFDENGQYHGNKSTKEQLNIRHRGIVGAMDYLNQMTGNAFKTKLVVISGVGLGAQFQGVKASSDETHFQEEMKTRCAQYAYAFKMFDTGLPADKSLKGWREHYQNYCGLSEVAALGRQMVFIGDDSEGLRMGALTPETNPYGKPGSFFVPALRDTFKEYGWKGFLIGPMLVPSNKPPTWTGPIWPTRTPLYMSSDGVMIPREGTLEAWEKWLETTR